MSRRVLLAALLAVGLVAGGVAQAKDKVLITMSSYGYLYLPPMVASEMGYFAEEGIEPDFLLTSGGAKALAAVISGDAQVYVGAPSSAFRAREKGQDALVVGADITQYAIDIVVTKKWAEKKGITPASSYKEKLAAMRGITIGISSPGSGTDQLVRFLSKAEGIDPDKELTMVAVGSPEAALAGFSQGRIDAFTMSQPAGQTAVNTMNGVMLFNMSHGEVKDLDGFLFIGLIVKQSWMEQKPELANRFLRAMQKALTAMHDPALSPKARDAIWAKYHKKTPKAEYDPLWADMMDAFPKTIALDEPMMKRVASFLAEFEKAPIDPKTFQAGWTNAYAEKALKSLAK